MADSLTHLDPQGRARMVDISAKAESLREATAEARVRMTAATHELLFSQKLPKGDALATARIAGIMAAKRTPELIPLCHPILTESVAVEILPDPAEELVLIRATVRNTGKTGAEMEAMTAATVAALTLYDMVKGVQRDVTIEQVRLIAKSGGKSGTVTFA
jgi:cyclic pyranopterin phosphate synthase